MLGCRTSIFGYKQSARHAMHSFGLDIIRYSVLLKLKISMISHYQISVYLCEKHNWHSTLSQAWGHLRKCTKCTTKKEWNWNSARWRPGDDELLSDTPWQVVYQGIITQNISSDQKFLQVWLSAGCPSRATRININCLLSFSSNRNECGNIRESRPYFAKESVPESL